MRVTAQRRSYEYRAAGSDQHNPPRADDRQARVVTELGDIFEPGTAHGRTYAALVHHPRSGLADIAGYLSVSPEAAAASLEILCDLQAAIKLEGDSGEPVWDAHAPESLSESEAKRR